VESETLAAILVAAGSGTRFMRAGGSPGKVFLPILGVPLYRHSLDTLLSLPEIDEVVVVTDSTAVGFLEADLSGEPRSHATTGGARRQDSVARGLAALRSGARWVAVHDAARPAVHPEDVRATFARAREVGAAILARRSTDTLKEVESGGVIARTLLRDRIWRAETPQMARRDLLERSFREWPDMDLATDEAVMLERAGIPVAVMAARHENPKVTVPGDLVAIEAQLRRKREEGGAAGPTADAATESAARETEGP
jgi:2-C-methyl-D-erythritol 4-phosphate cytidylyltransferase